MADQRRIVALNNQGVRLLQQKNHLHANQVLLKSLHKLKETLKRQRVPSGVYEKLPVVEDDWCSSDDRPNCFATVPLDLDCTVATSTASTASTPALPIFDRVFCFLPPGPSSQDDPTSRDNRDGSAAVILFNLAMAQQTRALHLLTQRDDSPQKSKVALAQALRMYTWALSALQHWSRHATTHQGVYLLRVATLHNMAVVQEMMHQTVVARKTWHCLKKVFSASKPFLERRDIHFFATNLSAVVVVVVCHTTADDNETSTATTTSSEEETNLVRTTSSLLGPAPAAAA